MILEKCFTKDWIKHARAMYHGTDPILIEKTIYAFELLFYLAESGHLFVFKGGTALLLHIKDAFRLSIDIDIVGGMSVDVLNNIIKNSRFTQLNEDLRVPKGIPKRHFAFSFPSLFQQTNSYILLDILEVKNPYSQIVKKPIQHPLFEMNETLSVSLPAIEGLLGDKLTAFAPETIGISYGMNKSMEIMKQLSDIGTLYDKSSNFSVFHSDFQSVYSIENKFRDSRFSYDDVLNDIINTSYLLCQMDLRGATENTKTQELREGIKKLKSHLLNTSFRLPDAKIAASRAAYLAAAVKYNLKSDPFEMRFSLEKIERLKDEIISGRFSIMNRLKSSLPEVFYYWYLISQ